MKNDRLNNLDAIRFIAAFMIVLYHYTYRGVMADNYIKFDQSKAIDSFKYLYLGVELFFMISGFVIFKSINKSNVSKFLSGRFWRLFPTFWICCFVTYFFIFYFDSEKQGINFTDLLLNMFLINKYFSVKYIDGVYWSLLVEIKFYAMVAVCMMFNLNENKFRYLLAWLIVTIFGDIADIKIIRTVFLTEYSVYFIFGASLYLLKYESKCTKNLLLTFSSLLLLIYKSLESARYLEEKFADDFNRIVVVALMLFFCSILYICVNYNYGKKFEQSLYYLGALTYPLYLLHQNIGYAFINKFFLNGRSFEIAVTVAITSSVVMSMIVYVVVENGVKAVRTRKVI